MVSNTWYCRLTVLWCSEAEGVVGNILWPTKPCFSGFDTAGVKRQLHTVVGNILWPTKPCIVRKPYYGVQRQMHTSCPQIFPQLVVVGLSYNSDIKFALLLEYLSFEQDKNEIKYTYILGSSFECSGKLKYRLYLNR